MATMSSEFDQWLSNNYQYLVRMGEFSGAYLQVYDTKEVERRNAKYSNALARIGYLHLGIEHKYEVGTEFDSNSTVLTASGDNRVWIYTNYDEGICIDLPKISNDVANRAVPRNRKYELLSYIDAPSTSSVMAFVENNDGQDIYLLIYDIRTKEENMILFYPTNRLIY